MIMSPDPDAFARVYQAHPFLDPNCLKKDPELTKALRTHWQNMKISADAYNNELNRFLSPAGAPRTLAENQEATRRYLVDVNAYLQEILRLVGQAARREIAMDPEVAATNDWLGLWDLVFDKNNHRMSFEALRKLYLAKLFCDIDMDPGVQRGPLHRVFFEKTLDQKLWSTASRMKPVDVYFDIAQDKTRMAIRTAPGAGEHWRFYLTRAKPPGRRPIHVYHYSCRFKREVAPQYYEEGSEYYEVEERPIWETLHRRRSGSILSKLIRKGESHVGAIQDLLGAMFIVRDKKEARSLQEWLYEMWGGPLRWRDRVNTMDFQEDQERLNPQSGAGYQVLKSDLSIPYSPGDGSKPYLVTVEIQIYTIEGYLRTVHTQHRASHHQLKLRQFMEGLLPYLFPTAVYGEETVDRCLHELVTAAG